jgi:hypothetical protein
MAPAVVAAAAVLEVMVVRVDLILLAQVGLVLDDVVGSSVVVATGAAGRADAVVVVT